MIRKVGSQWVVMNEFGKRMGTYDTLEEAKRRHAKLEFYRKKSKSIIEKDPNLDKGE